MIIWRGKGIVIALTTFGCLVASEYLCRTLSGNEHYYQTHGFPMLAAFLIAAASVYAMRPWLGVGKSRVLVDPATQQQVSLNGESSLFFVPARYWPMVLTVLGVLFGASASLGLIQ